MRALSSACERIGATAKRLEKVAILAEYFRARSVDEAATSAIFLAGHTFPAHEETTLQVGGTMLWRIVASLAPGGEDAVARAYKTHGDLGSAAQEVLAQSAPPLSDLGVLHVAEAFRAIAAASGPAAKTTLLRALLGQATALEAKYIVKIITADLRIGLKESLVEEAIAKAFGAPLPAVHRADMLLGDVGATLRLAAEARLEEAKMRLYHPLGFMLASPAESASEALESFPEALIEDKYDGIRAQAHCGGRSLQGRVRLFSRTLDDVTASFPELEAPLQTFPDDVILDGEIVAWVSVADGEGGHPSGAVARPFAQLQKRLGRKKVSLAMIREVPAAYVVFDVLYAGGELVIDRPLRERAAILDALFAARRPVKAPVAAVARGQLSLLLDGSPQAEAAPTGAVLRAPASRAGSTDAIESTFEAARARGNEGLMIKDWASTYAPGRRGRSWLKLKRELATLDVVVTAVEYGHGKRAGVLSDYTFAVRDDEGRLLNIGKAYSGLTDAELAENHAWFLEHTLEDHGFRRTVEPRLVLEVAFNNMMRSDRHESGYALRFPRILRMRPDKTPDQIDTLEAARTIFERQ